MLSACSSWRARAERLQRPAERLAASPRLLGVSSWMALKPASIGHFRAGAPETLIPRGFPACLAGEARFTRGSGQAIFVGQRAFHLSRSFPPFQLPLLAFRFFPSRKQVVDGPQAVGRKAKRQAWQALEEMRQVR